MKGDADTGGYLFGAAWRLSNYIQFDPPIIQPAVPPFSDKVRVCNCRLQQTLKSQLFGCFNPATKPGTITAGACASYNKDLSWGDAKSIDYLLKMAYERLLPYCR